LANIVDVVSAHYVRSWFQENSDQESIIGSGRNRRSHCRTRQNPQV